MVQSWPTQAPRARKQRLGAAAGVIVLLLAGCAADEGGPSFGTTFTEAETRIAYDVTTDGAPSEAVAALVEESIGLYRRREAGAQSIAFLRKRARDDVATIETILRSRGYYEGTAEIMVEEAPRGGTGTDRPRRAPGRTGSDGTPETRERGGSGTPTATVRVRIAPGPRYTLAEHRLRVVDTAGAPPDPLDAADLGSPVGGPAAAAGIIDAESAAVRALRAAGRPYAAFHRRDAVADPEADTLAVESVIAAGPPYLFGPLGFEGAPNVDPAYLETYRPWEPGTTADPGALTEYQRRLVATDLFRAVTVTFPEDPPEGALAPVTVRVEEAPFRTVSAGARFNTDTGPAVRLGFEHRNLFGANERLSAAAELELEEQDFSLAFSKPQFLRPGQFLEAEIRSFRVEDSPFDAVGLTGQAGLRRQITPALSIGAAGLVELAEIDERGPDGTSALVGLPAFVAWSTVDDPLDSTNGERARLTVTPFTGTFADEATTFVTLEARGASFHDLTGAGRYILAARARLGTTLADGLDSVPQTRRFYAGGGGSVRGFERYEVGPLDDRADPVGGLSVAELGLEFRGRIWNDVGGVIFVDSGTVSTEQGFAFDDDFLVAAGTGLRYYSPVGPIRLDVAFPLNGRDTDDDFEVYFSIGQAF